MSTINQLDHEFTISNPTDNLIIQDVNNLTGKISRANFLQGIGSGTNTGSSNTDFSYPGGLTNQLFKSDNSNITEVENKVSAWGIFNQSVVSYRANRTVLEDLSSINFSEGSTIYMDGAITPVQGSSFEIIAVFSYSNANVNDSYPLISFPVTNGAMIGINQGAFRIGRNEIAWDFSTPGVVSDAIYVASFRVESNKYILRINGQDRGYSSLLPLFNGSSLRLGTSLINQRGWFKAYEIAGFSPALSFNTRGKIERYLKHKYFIF